MMQGTKKQSAWEEMGRGLAGPVVVYGFLAAWAYCAWTYGFLWGFGLGWLPAGLLAIGLGVITYALWPLSLAVAGASLLYGVMWVATFFGWW